MILLGSAVMIWWTIVNMLLQVQCAYVIRLGQKLSMFEIRRVEADVRTCDPHLIHRITPRFKSMLHEMHQCGNLTHTILKSMVPATTVALVQFAGGIFIAAGDEEGGKVPAWAFFATFQPLLSALIYTYNYGLLNLAIERDIDQDIVEMNIRLTYSDSHVPNWLLQQSESIPCPPPPLFVTNTGPSDLFGATRRPRFQPASEHRAERRDGEESGVQLVDGHRLRLPVPVEHQAPHHLRNV